MGPLVYQYNMHYQIHFQELFVQCQGNTDMLSYLKSKSQLYIGSSMNFIANMIVEKQNIIMY